jgi:hypothetical protein
MLETINFNGTSLVVIIDQDGTRWVALRPICEAIGLAWQAQHHKIMNNPQFSCNDIMTTGSDGKTYKMTCLKISQINGWLFNINANRVNHTCRERLLTYQAECQDVLFKHFLPNDVANEELVNRIFTLEQTIERLLFILGPFLDSSASAAGTILEAHKKTKEFRN